MLSEVSQAQQNKYYVIPLYEVSRIGRFVRTESRWLLGDRGYREQGGTA